MNVRRALIALIAMPLGGTAPFAALAQAAGKRTRRIGFLAKDPSTQASQALRETFVAAMRGLGYDEGHDYTYVRVDAGGQAERLPAAAAELLASGVEVILTVGTQITLAAKNATSTVPIVMFYVSDPVSSGLVGSLARPEGNITGIADFDTELTGKRIQLLREIAPTLKRLAVVCNPDYPTHALEVSAVQAAAQQFGLQWTPVEVYRRLDLELALRRIEDTRPDAAIVVGGALSAIGDLQFGELLYQSLARLRVPNVAIGTNARRGAMLSYGSDFAREFHLAAKFVDKILKGAKPGDLPIEQVTKFDLIVNLTVAGAIGIKIPPSVLLRASEVIV